MQHNQVKISIGISTYNRPLGLARLIKSIEKIEIPDNAEVCVIVVDNSSCANAKTVVNNVSKDHPLTIEYYHEPKRGVVYPRNKILTESINNNSKYLMFIDDDEVPDVFWLVNLLKNIKETGVAVISGAVYPIFETEPSWWVIKSKVFEIVDYPVNVPVNYAHTGNVIIDVDVIDTLSISFDPEFSLSGGEDTMFFQTIRDSGFDTMFAKDALIYEYISTDRATLSWLFMRWFRTGNINAIIGLKSSGVKFAPSFRVAMGGVGRIVLGGACLLISLPFILFKNIHYIKCLKIICRGVGFVAGSTGFAYEEYRNINR